MTFKINILASDEVQYLDAYDVYTERTCLSKDGKFSVLWKIGTKYYAEINTYYDGNFWQGEDNAFERGEHIVEVKELTDEEVEEYFEAYKYYEPALYEQYGSQLSKRYWDTIQNLITMDYREINSLMAKCIRERNTPIAKSEEFREALINAENALRELKRFY